MEENPQLSSHWRRPRRGQTRGRLYLAVMFLLMFAFSLMNLLLTPSYDRQAFLLYEAPMGIVITSLLAGVWCRQFWARYLLIGVLAIRVAAGGIAVAKFADMMLGNWIFALAILSGPALYAAIIWALVSAPSIRRLVSRQYE